jgi:hypothetical protein
VSERPGWLARVDNRLVPGLAGVLRGVGRGGRRLGHAAGPPGRWLGRVARRNPTITTAVVAVAAAAVLIVTTGGDVHHGVAPTPPSAQIALPGDQLGPTTGEQVSDYLDVAAQRADALTGLAAPSVTAVVDFTSYLTPAAAETVLAGRAGVTVTTAYVRVPPPAAADVHAVAVAAASDLAAAVGRLAVTARQFGVNYREHVALAKAHPTAQNVQVVTQYAGAARQARIDASQLGPAAGCVFALEISGPPSQLQALAKQADVRVLDPAPSTVAAADLMIVPLEPQVTTVVPAPHFALATP